MWRKALFVSVISTFSLLVQQAFTQPRDTAQIEWEVGNRFRLFASQADFDEQVKAFRASGSKSVLVTEQKLALDSGGKGWASKISTLCFDTWRGRIIAHCKRDGVDETYINPTDARIRLTATLPADFGDATCDWQIGTGGDIQKFSANCRDPITQARASTKKSTTITVSAKAADGRSAQASIDIKVRDILIVGIGDSTASGEGNPTTPVALSAHGFCFERVLGLSRKTFYLPGREKADGILNGSCLDSDAGNPETRDIWDAAGANWLYDQCHRSLYSYQARVALAIAIENPQVSVTFLPLGCTGATIRQGILDSQEARERPIRKSDGMKPGPYVEGQISQLRNYLLLDGQTQPIRPIDLALLTIGANDIGFSGLVGDIIIKDNPERDLSLKLKVIVTPDQARKTMKETLRRDFNRLRQALASLTGGSMKKVLFTTYGNPGLYDGGKSCPSSRRGFDVHPAFAVDGDRIAKTVKFVNDEFLPELKKLVTCGENSGCTPATRAMVYVDGHVEAFGNHGFCAQSDSDPVFDKDCFRDGGSFKSDQSALDLPLVCGRNASLFKTYAKRARWIRTANDSYFAAMTYPTRPGFVQSPSNIHDALWGLESVVYGGAIHPTAEGHAAMADAALPAARALLGLPSP